MASIRRSHKYSNHKGLRLDNNTTRIPAPLQVFMVFLVPHEARHCVLELQYVVARYPSLVYSLVLTQRRYRGNRDCCHKRDHSLARAP